MPDKPCLWADNSNCTECDLSHQLACQKNLSHTLHFGIPFIILTIPLVLGIIQMTKLWTWIVVPTWAVYIVFFFLIWEPPILCAHCPYYAEPNTNILHCPINYGFIKTAKFNPHPMSKSEQMQFIIGALLLVLYPVPFLIIQQVWLYIIIFGILLVPSIFWIYSFVCVNCINFSCPLNHASLANMEKFFQKNQELAQNYQDFLTKKKQKRSK